MLFDFRASKFDQIAFSDVNLAIRNSLPMQKNHIYCLCRDFSYRRDQLTVIFVVWRRERRAGRAALRVGPKRPSQG